MWYIRRGEGRQRKFLSIYGGWRNPERRSVRENVENKPLPICWLEELERFETQKAATEFIRERSIQGLAVNGIC